MSEKKPVGRPKKMEETIKEVMPYPHQSGRPKLPPELRTDVKEYRKEYYKNNRDKFYKEEVCHYCQASFFKSNFKRHLNSRLHKYRVEKFEQENQP